MFFLNDYMSIDHVASELRGRKDKRDEAVLNGLAQFWRSTELQDYTVIVGNVHFGCHRLLLASCSDFFKGLFRSDMQETAQKCVSIQGMSNETFELILNRIYTGHVILTDDNVIDIWRAADQLQIHFLVSECENFVLKTLSMENCEEYFNVSNTLNSTPLLDAWFTFVAKNCNSFFKTRCFLRMSTANILRLIKSQELEIESEDDVIIAILKWAESQANNSKCSKVKEDGGDIFREQLDQSFQRDARDELDNQENAISNDIAILLSNARTCLVSQQCLDMLANHPLVRDNKQAIDIVNDCLLFQLTGHWSSEAVHRNNSSFLHCIVTAVKRKNSIVISAYAVARQKWYPISYSKDHETIKLAVANNKLYAFGICNSQKKSFLPIVHGSVNLHLWQPEVKTSKQAICINSHKLLVVVMGAFFYVFLSEEQTMLKIQVKKQDILKKFKLQGPEPIAHVMVYGQNILVFHAVRKKLVSKTMVRCYDTSSKSWTEPQKIKGPANGMTSFSDDHFTYILQSNGQLWKLIRSQSNIIDFETVAKLWSSDVTFHGAVFYFGDLYIGLQPDVDLPNGNQLPRSLPGLFRTIIYLEIASNKKAMFAPMVVSEDYFYKDTFPSSVVNKFSDLL